MKLLAEFWKRKSKKVKIIDVFCQNNYYYAKPAKGSYQMIYRAARGVYWDDATSSLYFKRETTRENALRWIAQAMKEEYGITLIFD